MADFIRIVKASENNLKNVSVAIPKQRFVVITGPSGSGKSTLALDIIQRESQRQYMELNGMTTNFINKPKMESISGLSPSIGIGQQQTTNHNPRSTVGTVTDMYTYLRVIYEKLGMRECPNCHEKVRRPPELDEESEMMPCSACGFHMKNLKKAHFSFNTVEGACEACSGLGKKLGIRAERVVDEGKSLNAGAVTVWNAAVTEYYGKSVVAAAKHYGFVIDKDLAVENWTAEQKDLLLYGVESEEFKKHHPQTPSPKTVAKGKFEGVLTGLWRRYNEKGGNLAEADFFFQQTCQECQGTKLKKESRQVTVAGKSISDVSQIPMDAILAWVEEISLGFEANDESVASSLVYELAEKIKRIIHVGIGYLSMERQSSTLSGGEAQRLRLATILGSSLTGVLYILDEPTAGLHPKDIQGLVDVLKQLRELGNSVLVIEHDVDVMKQADWIIDLGPGAGINGGQIVGEGTLDELMEQQNSVTGAYLKEEPPAIKMRRTGNGRHVAIHNAYKNNLKNITVAFPLGSFIAVTGVSGSGKSSLLFGILAASVETDHIKEGYDEITGTAELSRMVTFGQSGLTRMQRSNVATYTEIYTLFRNLFAKLPQAKERGLSAKHFSFNTEGGRCEHCLGMGYVFTPMYFLPDLEVICPVCSGNRFKEEVLAVTYKGKSISDILNISIEESSVFFADQKKIISTIELLCEVGLGYLTWGQTLTTLSGGEGQRLKLAKELNRNVKGETLYILDEPSTGLHPNDIKKLLILLNKLVDEGHTVIIVEHNIQIIKQADWVIDLGPEGGNGGGRIIAEGTPEEVKLCKKSYTGIYL
ncbi:excinuclease ABC subunit UvrA [Planococcus sp. 4-30]|uniref:excinuclease ABC subunit UvrA n=1 Tax=Planococcus sp. 4-30 TaxID=2874583 RepID=UPI001CC15158|nr:excinuclease ABC subunit UvrA [Planococcus sp. 4-30]